MLSTLFPERKEFLRFAQILYISYLLSCFHLFLSLLRLKLDELLIKSWWASRGTPAQATLLWCSTPIYCLTLVTFFTWHFLWCQGYGRLWGNYWVTEWKQIFVCSATPPKASKEFERMAPFCLYPFREFFRRHLLLWCGTPNKALSLKCSFPLLPFFFSWCRLCLTVGCTSRKFGENLCSPNVL